MKIFTASILVLMASFYSCSTPEALQVYQTASGINISYNNLDRLAGLKTGGVAYDSGKKEPIQLKTIGDFVSITLTEKGDAIHGPDEFYGVFFDSIPAFSKGVTLWRYKPWNAWTRPVKINTLSEIEDWDVQFFYWQYADGLYGAAMPLSGNGYRTTLGKHAGKFGAKSLTYGPTEANQDTIPQMLIGFGDDPNLLFQQLFETGLNEIGKPENLAENKLFPERMDYIGWCTWNASENGKLLTEDFVVKSVKTFTDNDFPLGWVMIDDGWFDHDGRMINSLKPDPAKFPNGFTSLNRRLTEECGVKEIGVWHSFNGYWNGINIDSELGEKYKDDLFSWQTKPWLPESETSDAKTYHFIKPESDALPEFYRSMHQTLKDQGFTFLKVDNQLVTEQMAPNNYPIFTLSEKMHAALNESVAEFFDGAVINCMDMTSEAYLNFGTSSVARAVEDYFPVEDNGVGYKMPYGNAAVHLVMAFYNSLYFQQMVYPDFDMFESHNPDAEYHAVARAINNGPIYVTDKPGEQNFDVLRKLCYSDGRLIRPTKALTPTEDCLFQIQDARAFKAFSTTSTGIGLLGVWNVADANAVSGQISPADVYGIQGDDFIVYEYFSKQHWDLKRREELAVELPRMGTKLFFIVPKEAEAAVLGLVDKYNAPGTVVNKRISQGGLEATVADHGRFSAIVPRSPKSVEVDGQQRAYEFVDKLLTVEIPAEDVRKNHTVVVRW